MKKQSNSLNELILFQEKIIDLLDNMTLLDVQIDTSNKISLKAFPQFNQQTNDVFNELVNDMNKNPQIIIDITKKFLNEKNIITKMFVFREKCKIKDNASVLNTIEKISILYESTTILKFPAYLLSKRNINYDSLNNSKSILKCFKNFGLSNNNIKNLRLIRNANSHKFSIEENKIILQDGSSLDATEVENLFTQYDNILTWWSTFYVLIFLSIPKFSLLVIIALYDNISNNKEDWKKYKKGIDFFFKDFTNNIKNKQKRKRKHLLKRNYQKILRKYNKLKKYAKNIIRSKEKKKIFQSNAETIAKKLETNINNLGNEILKLSEMLNNDNDERNLEKIANWFKNNNILHKFIDFFKDEPEEFLLMIKNKIKDFSEDNT